MKIMESKKLYKRVIIVLGFTIVFMLSIGFSALSSTLGISGSTRYNVKKHIRVTDVSLNSVTGGGVENYTPLYNYNQVTLGVSIPETGTVTYTITITNYSSTEYIIGYDIESSNDDLTETTVENYTNPVDTGTYTLTITISGASSDFDNINIYFTFMENTDVLYDIISSQSVMENTKSRFVSGNTGIDFSQISSDTNGKGIYTFASTFNDSYPIKYYRGAVTNNNVLFGGYCWKIVRTTSTGGVKLLYNGPISSLYDGNALTESEYIIVENNSTYPYMFDSSTNEWYSTVVPWENSAAIRFSPSTSGNYEVRFDLASGNYDNFYITVNGGSSRSYKGVTSGTISLGELTSSDIIRINFYVDGGGFSGTQILRFKLISRTSIIGQSCSSTGQDSILGSSSYGSHNGSYMHTGYLPLDWSYFNLYEDNSFSSSYTGTVFKSIRLNVSSYFASSYTYNSVTGRYTLDNPYQIASKNDYSSVIGSYTFFNSDPNSSNYGIYYIVNASSTYIYCFKISDGKSLNDYSITVGDSYIDNNNGTFTLSNTTTIPYVDWVTNYSSYKNKYMCNDFSATCEELQYTRSTSSAGYEYYTGVKKFVLAKSFSGNNLVDTVKVSYADLYANYANYSDYKYSCGDLETSCDNIKLIGSLGSTKISYIKKIYFGTGVTYNSTTKKYTLTNPKLMNFDYLDFENAYSNYHYFCPSELTTTCSEVKYFGYASRLENYIYYNATLKNGYTSIGDVLTNQFQNTDDSNIKRIIDDFYYKYIDDYSAYLEDETWCNDKSIYSYGGYNPNGGSVLNYLSFNPNNRAVLHQPSLACSTLRDRFTVNDSNGNRMSRFKIGMLTSDEVMLAGGVHLNENTSYYLSIGTEWFTISADTIKGDINVFSVGSSGTLTSTSYSSGVRPSISLRPNIRISGGVGTQDNPYVIALDAPYTISYSDSVGTGCNNVDVLKYSGNRYGDLCTPSYSGNKYFAGWYTGQNGTGTKITSNTTASSNRTLYAYWVTNNKLYDIISYNSQLDSVSSGSVSNTGISFKNPSSETNGNGIYTFDSTKNDTYPVYYYRGAVTNNNVLFGGYCWKIVRTTSTGGVKLIYNGSPVDNKCTTKTGTSTQISTGYFNSSSNSITYDGYMYGGSIIEEELSKSSTHNLDTAMTLFTSRSWSTSYYFSYSVSYDSNTGLYSLDDPFKVSSTSSYSSLIGAYTFLSSTQNNTSNSVYGVGDASSSSVYTYDITGGNLPTDYYILVGNNYTYNNNTYTLTNTEKLYYSSISYSYSAYPRYTCNSTASTCSELSVLSGIRTNGYSYCSTSKKIVFGKSLNGLQLVDTITLNALEIYNNWSRAIGYSIPPEYKYTCGDTNTTCTSSTLRVVTDSSASWYSYDRIIYYSESISYDQNTGYTLINPSTSVDDINQKYFCTTYGTTCSSVGYVYWNSLAYVRQSGGKLGGDDFLTDMSLNTNSSAIKTTIDNWYSSNLNSYTSYLEDTVYCSDRSYVDIGSFDPHVSHSFGFSGYNRYSDGTPSFTCQNNDSFTVSSNNGNGKLTYPVGLLTVDEAMLGGMASSSQTNQYLYNGQSWWLMTPWQHVRIIGRVGTVSSGNISFGQTNSSYGIRPVISLKPNITVTGGDGTFEYPYVINTN